VLPLLAKGVLSQRCHSKENAPDFFILFAAKKMKQEFKITLMEQFIPDWWKKLKLLAATIMVIAIA
jgi:hypothetical protein